MVLISLLNGLKEVLKDFQHNESLKVTIFRTKVLESEEDLIRNLDQVVVDLQEFYPLPQDRSTLVSRHPG